MPRAFFIQRSRAFSSGSPKPWTAKSTIVVVPPQAAAAVPVAKSSEAKVPPNGSSMWVCTSIPPGMTYRPAASMTVSAPAPVPVSASPVPIAWIRSPSISTSARAMSLAVTTVPFWISVVMATSWQLLRQLTVGLGPPVAEELPGVAHLADLVQVEVSDQHLVLAVRGLGHDLPARAAEVRGAVELMLVQRRLDADPVARRDPEPVGHRVRGLLELPQVLGERLDGRGRVEDELGALESQLAGHLREMPVVADDQAEPAHRPLPYRVAEVARLEVELLPEAGADVRDVSLAVLADHRAVALDHARRRVVDTGLLLLIPGHDQHDAVLAGHLAHPADGRPVLRLGRGVPLRVLLGAEIGAVEDLLEAHHLGALARRVRDHLDVLVDRLLLGHVGLRLDQCCAHRSHRCPSSVAAVLPPDEP